VFPHLEALVERDIRTACKKRCKFVSAYSKE
jgi:hypothetical protein